MWWRSASFILDKQRKPFLSPHPRNQLWWTHSKIPTPKSLLITEVGLPTRPSSPVIDWDSESGKPFSVTDEFNNRRKQPDLAAVIRSSQATTMMELEIELKKALDSSESESFLTSMLMSSVCIIFYALLGLEVVSEWMHDHEAFF
ncbi:hypothetical protein SDJN03_26053, partial [Cucurbita argyrosperma subsp. sororia]